MIDIISGVVIDGDKIGRTIGFPTANVRYISTSLPSAVFKINILIQWKLYSWMGVHAVWKETFEVHIFDFEKDIYWETIEIYLLQQIRENRKFHTLDDLSKQLQEDKRQIESIDLKVLTFWSFDVVHKWHTYYLSEAKKHGDTLITIVANDENIQRIKWHAPTHNQEDRKHAITELWISDIIHVWSSWNPMQWLTKYKPHIICLGYDQRWPFVEKLPRELKNIGLTTKIVRIAPLHPEKFKSSILKKASH